VNVANTPAAGTPFEAQTLARAQLTAVGHNIDAALRSAALDTATRAHLIALRAKVTTALK
jgi:hypothetical protein